MFKARTHSTPLGQELKAIESEISLVVPKHLLTTSVGTCSGFDLLICNFLANVLVFVVGLVLAKLPVYLLELFIYLFIFVVRWTKGLE